MFVAVHGSGDVIGTISCKVETGGGGHLRGMAVRPEWQGSPVANELLARAEQYFQEAGCLAITLDTTQPLKRAMRFYVKHGFRSTGRVIDSFGMPLFEYRKPIVRK